jgi:fido (protein-threonine AMPylation protein)
VREVSRCVDAMAHALERLRGGFPLSLRLLREIHAVLVDHPRGMGKTPGEFRRSKGWLGGTRPGDAIFVPPPADELPSCMDAFERFLHDDPEPTAPLLRAALTHVQFETIHPFLDGNGRIGRMLIVLQLVADGVLREPLLRPSLFFKAHRSLHYELLDNVRLTSHWERWLEFFAEGIHTGATQGVHTAQALLHLVATDHQRIDQLGRAFGPVAARGPAAAAHHHGGGAGPGHRFDRSHGEQDAGPFGANRHRRRTHGAPARPCLRIPRLRGAAQLGTGRCAARHPRPPAARPAIEELNFPAPDRLKRDAAESGMGAACRSRENTFARHWHKASPRAPAQEPSLLLRRREPVVPARIDPLVAALEFTAAAAAVVADGVAEQLAAAQRDLRLDDRGRMGPGHERWDIATDAGIGAPPAAIRKNALPSFSSSEIVPVTKLSLLYCPPWGFLYALYSQL